VRTEKIEWNKNDYKKFGVVTFYGNLRESEKKEDFFMK
jgi:hypothetical protein